MTVPGGPPKLESMRAMFSAMDRAERIQALIDVADGFRPVPEAIAARPYPGERRVPHCESEAFVFAVPRDDGTLKFHFAVENPQGISAMAAAVILDKTCSGAPLDLVESIDPDVMYDIFGRELSMGKNMGLTSLVNMVRAEAARHRR